MSPRHLPARGDVTNSPTQPPDWRLFGASKVAMREMRKADRREPLMVVRLALASEIAKQGII
jgi:hypothetical protein